MPGNINERTMRWARYSVGLLAAALAAAAVACGNGDSTDGDTPLSNGDKVTPTATATVPGEATATSTPASTPTGIAALDSTIGVLVSADLDRVLGLLDYHEVACAADPGGMGGPPRCAAGEPDGTRIRVLTLVSCEHEHMRPENAAGTFEWLGNGSPEVFAVVQLEPADPGALFPLGEYAVILQITGGRGPSGYLFGLDQQGRIVSAGHWCLAPPESILDRLDVADFLVRPEAT